MAMTHTPVTADIDGYLQNGFSAEDEFSGFKKWLETSTFIKFFSQVPQPLDGLVSIWHLGVH